MRFGMPYNVCRSRGMTALAIAVLVAVLFPGASLARDRKPVKLGAAALDSIAAPLNVDMIMRSDSIVGDTVFFSTDEPEPSAYDVWKSVKLHSTPILRVLCGFRLFFRDSGRSTTADTGNSQ